jgi:hypothetical protein
MKSEDRILELLAEYLHKTDQVLDSTGQTSRSVEIMSKALADYSVKILGHSVQFNNVQQEIKQLREDQGIMLKELISLSKRVSIIEGNS